MQSSNIKVYVALFFALAVILVARVSFFEKKSKNLVVSVFDVGQADAIYIKSPTGTEVLIDGGRDKKVLQRLGSQMSIFDRRIDIVLATHPDLDHIGGLPEVLSRYKVGLFIDSGARSDSDEYNILQQKIIAKRLTEGMEVRVAFSGQKIDLGGGVSLDILYPNKDMSSIEEVNDASVITLLTYKKNTFLLTGDAPSASEIKVLDLLPSDVNVLKLGHHGSQTSTSFELLEKTTPEIVVVSSGKNNTYGHPNVDVMKRVEDFRSKVYRTDRDGSITFVSDGENINIKTAK